MVKCVDCGFLAMRNTETRELEEIDHEVRRSGLLPIWRVPAVEVVWYGKSDGRGGSKKCECQAVCFLAAHDLRSEIESLDVANDREGAHLTVFNADRDCQHHTKYMQGFAPKEHAQLFLLDKQRELIEEKRHKENLAVAMASARIGVIGGLVGAVVGAILAAALT